MIWVSKPEQTCDETWIYQYDPESKQEWGKREEKPPRKFKVQRVATKLMATVFWGSSGILLIDYLRKGATMNGEYYAALIAQVREAIKEKRRGKLAHGVLLQQDNAYLSGCKARCKSLHASKKLTILHIVPTWPQVTFICLKI